MNIYQNELIIENNKKQQDFENEWKRKLQDMVKLKKEAEAKDTSEVRSESFDPQPRQPKIIEVKSLDSLTISSIKSNKSQDNEKNTVPES